MVISTNVMRSSNSTSVGNLMHLIVINNKMDGVDMGKSKVWSLAYTDDLVVIVIKERELKTKATRLEHFPDRRKLVLNVEKFRINMFKEEWKKYELAMER